MRKEINEKMADHIKQILDKPFITNEDYAILEHELEKEPANNARFDSFWTLILFFFIFGFDFGGKKDEL